MSNDMDEIVQEFLVESYESLDRLDGDLLALERDPHSKDTLASIFRVMHTIKGTCGFLGFSRLERVAHAAESLLGTAETESLTPSDEKHFSESDLSSEPWDADDFWGAESFAEAGETDEIFGLPYDSQGEPEEQRGGHRRAQSSLKLGRRSSADITARATTETGAATDFDEEDVQSIGRA